MADQTNSLTGKPEAAEPAELRAQIAATRNEMGNTIEELHGRLNPAVLKDQAIEQFHEATETVKAELKAHFSDAKEALKTELRDAKLAIKTEIGEELRHAKAAVREATLGKVENMVHTAQTNVRAASRTVVDVVRENPVPAAMVGLGLAWLIMNGRRARQQRQLPAASSSTSTMTMARASGEDLGMQEDGMVAHAVRHAREAATAGGHRIGEAAQTVGRKVAEVAQSAGHGIAAAAQGAGHGIGAAAHKVGETAAGVAHGAADTARAAKTKVTGYYDVNPIPFGIAALAVGAGIGLALPRTELEDNMLGAARDQVIDKAGELAHQAMGQAGELAQQLTEQVSGSGALAQGDAQRMRH